MVLVLCVARNWQRKSNKGFASAGWRYVRVLGCASATLFSSTVVTRLPSLWKEIGGPRVKQTENKATWQPSPATLTAGACTVIDWGIPLSRFARGFSTSSHIGRSASCFPKAAFFRAGFCWGWQHPQHRLDQGAPGGSWELLGAGLV